MDILSQFLSVAAGLPAWVVYIGLGAGATLENFFPPVPADTFVVLGAFWSAREGAFSPVVLFLVTWIANTAGAVLVYFLGFRYGPNFFEGRVGRYLLNPKQMGLVQSFYDRWGGWALFFSRFLPGIRAVVPVFAGVSQRPALSVVPPILFASGLWHGALVAAGVGVGENLDRLLARIGNINLILGVLATVVVLVVLSWWRTTRRVSEGNEDG